MTDKIQRVVWTAAETAVLWEGFTAGGADRAYDLLHERFPNGTYRTLEAVRQKAWSLGLKRRVKR